MNTLPKRTAESCVKGLLKPYCPASTGKAMGKGHRATFLGGKRKRAPVKEYNVKVSTFCLPSSDLLKTTQLNSLSPRQMPHEIQEDAAPIREGQGGPKQRAECRGRISRLLASLPASGPTLSFRVPTQLGFCSVPLPTFQCAPDPWFTGPTVSSFQKHTQAV